MTMQILPVDNSPNQRFKSTLSIGSVNISLLFNVRYNEIAKYWVITISDPAQQKVLIDSMPLLTRAFPAGNIMEQLAYLAIGAAFLINVGSSDLDHPDDTALGRYFDFIWSDTI
jgi:hypothetical protein